MSGREMSKGISVQRKAHASVLRNAKLSEKYPGILMSGCMT